MGSFKNYVTGGGGWVSAFVVTDVSQGVGGEGGRECQLCFYEIFNDLNTIEYKGKRKKQIKEQGKMARNK